MKTYLLTLMLVTSAVLGLAAPNGAVRGTVTDASTKEALPFVNVQIKGTDLATPTDFDGNYYLADVPPGTHTLVVTFIGYKTQEKTVTVKANEITKVNIALEANPVMLEEVAITSEKRSRARRESSKVSTSAIRSVESMPRKAASPAPSPGVISPKAASDSYYSAPATTGESTSIGAISMDSYESYDSDVVAAEPAMPADPSVRVVPAAPKEKPTEETPVKPEAKPDREFGQVQPKPGQLTAGRWSDLDNWDFYNNLMQNKTWSRKQKHWGFHFNQRFSVAVTHKGHPVVDARVQLRNNQQVAVWEGRTNNQGEVELFAGLFDQRGSSTYSIEVQKGRQGQTYKLQKPQGRTTINLAFDHATSIPQAVDVMLVMDATGSMGDELQYLQSEFANVMRKVQTYHRTQDVRASVNFYRDLSDSYIVKSHSFSSNMDEVAQQINEQSAGGGGDYEEAVELALEDALHKHLWKTEARTRLLFLVLDAPPHYTSENIGKMQMLAKEAAAKGIRIIPIASSGIDKDTEFLLRFLSMSTEGEYLFLTDHSGIGGSHMEPTIGPHAIHYLNDLLVEIVDHYVETEKPEMQATGLQNSTR